MLTKLFTGKFSILLFAGLCIFHLKFGVIAGWNKIISDFPNYYISSEIISENKDAGILYNDTLFNNELKNYGMNVQGQFSLYPPPTAFILLPLSQLDPLNAKRSWMIINIILLLFCIILIQKILTCNFIFAGNVMLITGFCLTNDLMLGQVYLFMLTLTLGGYYLIKNRKFFTGSFLWGMVMSVKYYTVVLIPVYLFQKKYKVAIYLLISFLFINLCCLFFTGPKIYIYFLKHIFANHLEGKIIGQKAFSVQFQSFESMFNMLFTRDAALNPFPFYESELLFIIFKSTVYLLLFGCSLLLIIKSRNSENLEEISAASLMTLLLLLEPGSATYHLLLLIFPIGLAIRVFKNKNMESQINYLLIAAGSIGFLSVVLNKAAVLYQLPLLLQYNRLWLLLIFYGFLHAWFYKMCSGKFKIA